MCLFAFCFTLVYGVLKSRATFLIGCTQVVSHFSDMRLQMYSLNNLCTSIFSQHISQNRSSTSVKLIFFFFPLLLMLYGCTLSHVQRQSNLEFLYCFKRYVNICEPFFSFSLIFFFLHISFSTWKLLAIISYLLWVLGLKQGLLQKRYVLLNSQLSALACILLQLRKVFVEYLIY